MCSAKAVSVTGNLSEGPQVRAEIAGGTKAGEVSSECSPGCREICHQKWHKKIGIKKVPLCGTIQAVVSQKLSGQGEPYE